MGTQCALALANLFMGGPEKNLLDNYQLQPIAWLRYIDDIFLIWAHLEDELQKFVMYANSVHHILPLMSNFVNETAV